MSAACYHGRRARGMKARNEAMIERRWKTLLISVILLMLGLGIPMDLAAETREEKVDDVVLRVPTAWKKETPKSTMWALQFSIPPVSEDSRPAQAVPAVPAADPATAHVPAAPTASAAAHPAQWTEAGFHPTGRPLAVAGLQIGA